MAATVQVCHQRYRVVSAEGTSVAEGEFESPAVLIDLLDDALHSLRNTTLALEVGRPWAQARRVRDLPPVKDRHLAGLVRSDAGRYFRSRPGDLHVEARRGDDGEVVAVALDAWLPTAVSRAARGAGGGLVRTTVVGAGDAPYPATPLAVRRDRRRLGTRALLAWMPIAIVPWLAAGTIYAADLHQDLRTLETGQAELATAERALREIEAELGVASSVVESIRRTGRDAAWAVPLLASLARDLPVDASLIEVTAERGGPCSLEVSGDTAGVGAALAWLVDPVAEGARVTASGCR